MKNLKKYLLILTAMSILVVSTTAFALATKSPAEIVAALSGKTVEEVNKEKAAGKTYGLIAKEAGKLEEFKSENLQQKKAMLDQKVKDGLITQEQADEVYNAIKTNQSSCDGTGKAAIGKKFGLGFGQGKGMGNHNGSTKGQGNCSGMGSGQSKCMGNMMGRGNGTGIHGGANNSECTLN